MAVKNKENRIRTLKKGKQLKDTRNTRSSFVAFLNEKLR